MTKILKVVRNEEDGVQAEIAAYHKGGYVVGLRDLDSDIRFPHAKVFPEWANAVTAAESWTAGEPVKLGTLSLEVS